MVEHVSACLVCETVYYFVQFSSSVWFVNSGICLFWPAGFFSRFVCFRIWFEVNLWQLASVSNNLCVFFCEMANTNGGIDEVDVLLRSVSRKRKRGEDLTADEEDALRAFMDQDDEEEDDGMDPFENEEDGDADYVPEGDASDVEDEVDIEIVLAEDDDEEDVEEIFEQSIAAALQQREGLAAEGHDMPEPMGDVVAGAIDPPHALDKDGKKWYLDAPATGRPRAHTIPPLGTKMGVQRCISSTATPVQIFKSLMSPELVSVIVRETNRRAHESFRKWNEEHPDSVPRKWDEVKETELYAFIGLLLFAGVFTQNSQPTKEMWAQYNQPIYKATMSLVRFRQLLTYIRFDNQITRAVRLETSKSAAIDDIWQMLMANLERAYQPQEQVTVDEQLFPYRGRTRFTQYMPSKPAKYGIKIWWMCDALSHYPLKGIIYTGRQAGEARATDLGENVVKALVRSYEKTGRTIYADNFFSSLPLVEWLMDKRLAFVGTLKWNKRCLTPDMRNDKRKLFDTVFGFYDNKVALCSYQAKKDKIVRMISTVHYTKTFNGSQLKPQQIMDYNKYKGGVDTMDQMVSGYTSKRSTKRWPLALFFNMLDVAGLAAYIIHDILNPLNRRQSDRRRKFIVELAHQLVTPHMEERAVNSKVIAHKHITNAMAAFNVLVIFKFTHHKTKTLMIIVLTLSNSRFNLRADQHHLTRDPRRFM